MDINYIQIYCPVCRKVFVEKPLEKWQSDMGEYTPVWLCTKCITRLEYKVFSQEPILDKGEAVGKLKDFIEIE